MKPLSSALQSSLPDVVAKTNNNAFRAAGQAMAELGVASCIGTACVKKELLNSATVQALSKVTFSILLPMFLGTSIIKTVTSDHGGLNRRTSLALPLLAVIQTTCLFILSKYVLLPLFGIAKIGGDDDNDDNDDAAMNDDAARVAMVCCSWGNTSVVPLIFIEALFRHPYEPASVLAQCYGYISLYLVGWSPFFWSFGRSVLIKNDDNLESNKEMDDKVQVGFSLTTLTQKLREMKRLFPPPVVGVVVGLMIGLSPLRHLFVNNLSKGYHAPFAVVFNSFQNLGRAAAPLALLVLTSSLALGAGKNDNVKQKENGAQDDGSSSIAERGNSIQKWACVSTARFIASPLLMWYCLKYTNKLGMIGNAQIAPILWFTLLLESCMPPAQNAVLMLQVANKRNEASQLAKFLLCIYITAMIPVALIVATSLQTLGLA